MLKSILVTVTATAIAAFSSVRAESESAKPTPPNDAQIAQIVLIADGIDVDYGKLAVEKTANADVKAFAETMVRDHSAVNDQAKALATKLNVTPQDSDISNSLKAGGEKKLAELKGLSGADFDKAYVDNEVAYHGAVIETLDTVLLPNVSNAELKALLEAGRPIFIAHLEHAKKLQSALNK